MNVQDGGRLDMYMCLDKIGWMMKNSKYILNIEMK